MSGAPVVPADAARQIDLHVAALLRPALGGAHQHERERSILFLVERAEAASPRVLEALARHGDDQSAVGLMPAVARLGRQDGVAPLERIVARGKEVIARAAAQALGRHPHPDARAALERLLGAKDDEVLIAAAQGAAARKDDTLAAAVRPLLSSSTGNLRWHALHALHLLHGTTEEELARLERDDPSKDVRELARSLRTH